MGTKLRDGLEDLPLEVLQTGIIWTGGDGECIVCGARFETGIIYPADGVLMEATRAAREHVKREHGGMFTVLMGLPRSTTGLTEVQRTVLGALHAGKDDREIAIALGGKTESTVRNHRFQIRKRRLEARILLALTDMIAAAPPSQADFIHFPADMPNRDDRIATTNAEAERILQRYTRTDDAGLQLLRMPRKQKEKLVILKRIAEEFVPEQRYPWKEVDSLLKAVHDDYVTIRRYLIDYRFLRRTDDGSEYWVPRGEQ